MEPHNRFYSSQYILYVYKRCVRYTRLRRRIINLREWQFTWQSNRMANNVSLFGNRPAPYFCLPFTAVCSVIADYAARCGTIAFAIAFLCIVVAGFRDERRKRYWNFFRFPKCRKWTLSFPLNFPVNNHSWAEFQFRASENSLLTLKPAIKSLLWKVCFLRVNDCCFNSRHHRLSNHAKPEIFYCYRYDFG